MEGRQDSKLIEEMRNRRAHIYRAIVIILLAVSCDSELVLRHVHSAKEEALPSVDRA